MNRLSKRLSTGGLLTLLLLAMGGTVLADIAPDPVPTFGETLAPKGASPVAMSSEVVTIRLEADRAEVQAFFQLVNTSSASERLDVGFPTVAQPMSYTWAPEGISVEEWGPTAIENPVFEVDGKQVEAQSKDAHETQTHHIRGWLCWPMNFGPGQKREVHVRYRVRTKDFNYIPPSELQNRRMSYVLTTGADWHGPIGSAKISVELHGVHNLKARPEPKSSQAELYTWEWSRLEPTADMLFEYQVYKDTADAISRLEEVLKRRPKDLEARLDYAENLAAAGRHDKAAEAFAWLSDHEDSVRGDNDVEEEPLSGIDPRYIRRPRTPYVPIAYRAAKSSLAAGNQKEARRWCKKAARLIDELLKPSSAPAYWFQKAFQISRGEMAKYRDDCPNR